MSVDQVTEKMAGAAISSVPPHALLTRAPSENTVAKMTKEDFEFGDVLGEGAYAKVYLAKRKADAQDFAVKCLEKKHLISMGKVKAVQTEKAVLHKLRHENIVKLFGTFQDKEFLYMVLELATGGELFTQIKRVGGCSLEHTRFYTAEVVNALEYLNSQGIIHRDLKPENILLSADGHVKITDFGTAKDSTAQEVAGAKPTFVGTAEYVSPEVLKDEPASVGSDLWALGCIVYHCLTGRPPFRAGSEYLTFQRIMSVEFAFPPNFPDVARDLICKLLVRDPTARLGYASFADLKAHAFFEGIDFAHLSEQDGPSIMVSSEVPEPEDGNSDELLLQDVPVLTSKSNSMMSSGSGGGGSAPPSPSRTGSVVASEADPAVQWGRFLINNEHIVHHGQVLKRKGMFARKRHLILTDFPRLIYIDRSKMEKKGEINYSERLQPELKNNRVFYVHTPGRTYNLTCLNNQAGKWVSAIREMKEKFYE